MARRDRSGVTRALIETERADMFGRTATLVPMEAVALTRVRREDRSSDPARTYIAHEEPVTMATRGAPPQREKSKRQT
jgi:hypothetical protein